MLFIFYLLYLFFYINFHFVYLLSDYYLTVIFFHYAQLKKKKVYVDHLSHFSLSCSLKMLPLLTGIYVIEN